MEKWLSSGAGKFVIDVLGCLLLWALLHSTGLLPLTWW